MRLAFGDRQKQILNGLGAALGLAGIVFVFLRLRSYGASLDLSTIDGSIWLACAILLMVGIFANGLLMLAWRWLLRQLSVDVTLRFAVETYGVAQLAKYVPGNIFHYASRQVMGLSAGLPGGALAKSAFLELALICLAAIAFFPLALPLMTGYVTLGGSVLLCIVTIAIEGGAVHRFVGLSASRAFFLYTTFLLLSGLSFLGLLLVCPSTPIPGNQWMAIGAAYVAAWLVGLLTPGAPAGLGVRELVLVFLLSNTVDEPQLLLALLLTRVLGVLADTLTYAAAAGMRMSRQRRS